MPTIVRMVEYEYCAKQAHEKALCPFCCGWHRASDGLAMQGPCVSLYVRHKSTAIIARGIVKARGGGYRTPSGRELDRALAHAVANAP